MDRLGIEPNSIPAVFHCDSLQDGIEPQSHVISHSLDRSIPLFGTLLSTFEAITTRPNDTSPAFTVLDGLQRPVLLWYLPRHGKYRNRTYLAGASLSAVSRQITQLSTVLFIYAYVDFIAGNAIK